MIYLAYIVFNYIQNLPTNGRISIDINVFL